MLGASAILCIPLARFPHDDYIVWRVEASREYLVRGGYKLILQGILDLVLNYNQNENVEFYRNFGA